MKAMETQLAYKKVPSIKSINEKKKKCCDYAIYGKYAEEFNEALRVLLINQPNA